MEEGYDPVLERPLKRVIQKRIQNELTLKLLRGEVKDGDRVIVDVGLDGRLHSPSRRLSLQPAD